jgi:hypothetical protein
LNIPSRTGFDRGATLGLSILGGMSALPFTLPRISEDSSNENYRTIQGRLMGSDIKTQASMIEYMKNLSESPDGSIRPDATKMGWFGGVGAKDLAGFYKSYESQLSDFSNPNRVKEMMRGEDALSLKTSVSALFGSPGYKNVLSQANLPENLLEQLTYAAGGDTSGLQGLKVDPSSFNAFAKSFAGSPGGIGTLLNKMTTVGDDGSLSVKTSGKDYEKFTDELQVLMQKKFGDNDRWKNAQEIWDGKRFSEAKTIQDHATATAKGLEIYFGSGEKSQWNKAFNNSDKA